MLEPLLERMELRSGQAKPGEVTEKKGGKPDKKEEN